jgi:molybdopterin molybdotransferase
MTPIENKGLRRHYVRGILKRQGSIFIVSATGPQGSGILTSMTKGNCFILVPKGKDSINKDEQVDCEVFQGLYSF